MVVDQDQQWLLGCLTASLDPNQNVRSFAETSLNQASLQPGMCLSLIVWWIHFIDNWKKEKKNCLVVDLDESKKILDSLSL